MVRLALGDCNLLVDNDPQVGNAPGSRKALQTDVSSSAAILGTLIARCKENAICYAG